MANLSSLRQAVEAGIAASAHMQAYEHVSAAAQACQRLGALTSGRWRAAARDLERLQEDLQTAFSDVAYDLEQRAASLSVNVEQLWSAGDAAGTLDVLRDDALDLVDEDTPAEQILRDSGNLFGVTFLEDEGVPERGQTLLFTWPVPLEPVIWAWQATWVVGDGHDDEEEELELFESDEATIPVATIEGFADELRLSREAAREALVGVAEALTRASLLAGSGDDEEEGEDEEAGSTNGEP